MKHIKLKISPYHSRINVITAKSLTEVEKAFDLTSTKGYDAMVWENKDQFYVAFKGKPKMAVIHHEVTHLVNCIFKKSGVKLDLDNDEHQAYFSAYLFGKIMKVIKKK